MATDTIVGPSRANLGSSLTFMASLNVQGLTRSTNEPIRHHQQWPSMPAKLPLDIAKFEGKVGEDPQNHIMSFHIWCSSNNIVDDSSWLRLFQHTLTGVVAKWYNEFPHATYPNFSSLASMFLQYFQLPVCYDEGVEILLSCQQNTSTHITNDIHDVEIQACSRLISPTTINN